MCINTHTCNIIYPTITKLKSQKGRETNIFSTPSMDQVLCQKPSVIIDAKLQSNQKTKHSKDQFHIKETSSERVRNFPSHMAFKWPYQKLIPNIRDSKDLRLQETSPPALISTQDGTGLNPGKARTVTPHELKSICVVTQTLLVYHTPVPHATRDCCLTTQ